MTSGGLPLCCAPVVAWYTGEGVDGTGPPEVFELIERGLSDDLLMLVLLTLVSESS